MLMADTVTRTLTISGGGASHSVTVPSTFLYTPSSVPLGILCANMSSEAGGFEIRADWRDMNENAIIKRFQVYYNNVLAYDLIPVQNANDVTDCGLYDRIHRKYYPGANYYNNTPFTAGTPTGEVINQLDECVEAGYLRVNNEWWEIYNGGTEYFAGNYIEITENNVITSTLKAGTNIQIADDGTISASGAEIVQTVTSGTQLATINGTSIYAPTVSATQTQTSGTEIGNITVGSTSTTLYAPTPQSVSVSQTLTSGTEIGSVTIDNITTTLYAPSGGGGGGSGSGYTETSLWSGTQTTTGTLALSDSIQNYDIIVVRWSPHQQSTNYYQQTNMILVSSIVLGSTYQYLINTTTLWKVASADYYSAASFHFTDYTHLTLDEVNTSTYFIFTLLEVIGLKFGGGSSGHNYSTDEQVIGTWIDGSTIYECTYDLGSDLTLQDSTWTDIGISVPTNANRCIKAEGIQSDGTSTCIMASVTSTNITVQSTKNSGDSIRYLTIQYTKTS